MCAAVSAGRVHVVAHGLGAAAALRLASDAEQGLVRSLTLVSPYGALADLRANSSADLLPTRRTTARESCIAEALGGGRSAAPSGEALGGAALAAKLRGLAGVPVLLATGGPDDIVNTAWDPSRPR